MTFTVFSVDLATGDCVYSSACHEPVIVLTASVEKYSVRDMKFLMAEAALPLGAKSPIPYAEYEFKLAKGDRLFLYSDGVYDVEMGSGRSWSRSDFRKKLAIIATDYRNTQDLVENFKQKIADDRQGTPLIDDITFFAFQL
jgi:sigma-B regulation protein RsbU (phosphoserine phosphatase)